MVGGRDEALIYGKNLVHSVSLERFKSGDSQGFEEDM